MGRRKKIWYLSALLIFVLLLSACGKAMYKSDNSVAVEPSSDYGSSYDKDTSDSQEIPMNPGKGETASDEGGVSKAGTDIKGVSVTGTDTKEKIIYRYMLDVETQNFDKLLEQTTASINSMGGYIETSKIGGRSFMNDNVERTGYIIARVPSDKAGEFLAFIKEEGNVTKSEQSSENVSLAYVDAQSRVSTLEIEQERLYDILKNAKDLESLISLETRLSEIRYELEKYQSQLRLYDNQVEYSFVTMNFQEVRRISPSEEVKPSFINRISNGLTKTFDNVSNGFLSFIIWFVVNIPYFIIWGVIILIASIIVRKFVNKRLRNKKPEVTVLQENEEAEE